MVILLLVSSNPAPHNCNAELRKWKLILHLTVLSLMALAQILLLALCGLLQNKALSGYDSEDADEKAFNQSSQLASDAVTNIRTVASFGLESALVKDYAATVKTKAKKDVAKANMSGIGFGSFMLIIFWI